MIKTSKVINLCADDYGLNLGISSAICQLIELQRLTSVSCLVNFPDFPNHAKKLLEYRASVAIGLHFNFTEGQYLSQPTKSFDSLYMLLCKSHGYLLDKNSLINELNYQIDYFIESFGFLPDFIDGHQHIHQFPVIREALLEVYNKRLSGKLIRCTYPFLAANTYKCRLKSFILSAVGGFHFHKLLQTFAIPHNAYFSGIYDFKNNENYRKIFRYWLSIAKTNTLIMCHPGLISSKGYKDTIAASRQAEFSYFSSTEFLDDCAEYNIIIKNILTISP